ncbi:MAG TPA: hypothetical protein VM266_09225 [Solirubrobacteraceae bacterium]|nr:hypothetical protein [Solirubrobacteraceae bacterium]
MFQRTVATLLASTSIVLALLAAAAGPAAAAPGAPQPLTPAADAVTEDVPAFSWRAVRRATAYEFQLSADSRFGSIVGGDRRGSIRTANTYATVNVRTPDGTYHWRVRAIDARGDAGRWSAARSFTKTWSPAPKLLGPPDDQPIVYPRDPLVLEWSPVASAHHYLVTLATDRSLASPVAGARAETMRTDGTKLALLRALPDGRYYWAVTPVDVRGHSGRRSAVGSFTWSWPTQTATRVADLNEDPRVDDPQLSWDPVPGAAAYAVEVSSSDDFATGSRVCCDDPTTGTSLSPRKVLPNNSYFWRVRAIDLDGNSAAWNAGPPFRKSFDDVPGQPTIPNLRLRDHLGEPVTDLQPQAGLPPATSNPAVVWEPVPGAASYEVNVVPYELGGCNWTAQSTRQWHVKTAATAWTPLSGQTNGQVPGGVAFPRAAHDAPRRLEDGGTYCVRVLARSDRDAASGEVVSDWTQLNGLGQPAFRYRAPSVSDVTGRLAMPAENYRGPQTGTLTPRLPLFTWLPVAGARSYFVVVAKDALFTEIVDVALTTSTAYAPRDGVNPRTYPDETTQYYWAVVPASGANGSGATTQPTENHPQTFEKRSVPPTLLAPAAGADVTGQPTFRWQSVEGARDYRLQVAQDPSFGDPIEDLATASTAFTSSSTYPADAVLYWRVRANDENRIGLTWSATSTFRRRLPRPVAAPGNATAGELPPVISWLPVQGAVSYDLHVEQPDGIDRNFTMRSPTFTFAKFYGTGAFRFRLRANFPKLPQGTTSGPWSETAAFTRHIGAPTGAKLTRGKGRLLASWDPHIGAKNYRLQFSDTNSFARIIDQALTDNTSYAPDLSRPGFTGGGRIFWRVAAVDEGRNSGAWALGSLKFAKTLVVTSGGGVMRGRESQIMVRVADGRGRPVRGARVRVSGGGIRARTVRTRRDGSVRLKVTPRRGGALLVRATKKGFKAGRLRVAVR